jgi:TRAP-type C4-dicarboxylate transport system permease small subunit
MTRRFVALADGLSYLFAVVATLLLVAAMLVVCEMIVIRYALRAATIWQTDFVIFSATAAIFLGAPYVLLKKGHVGVDVIEMLLPPAGRRGLKVVAALLGLAFCAAMLAASWINLEEAWSAGWRHSSVWAPPLWVPLSSLPIGFGLLCLQYVSEILKLLAAPPAAEPHGIVAEAASYAEVVTEEAAR